MPKEAALAYEEFCINAYRLVQISDSMNDQWRLHGSEDIPGSMYLTKQQKWGGDEHMFTQCLQGEAPHQWGMDPLTMYVADGRISPIEESPPPSPKAGDSSGKRARKAAPNRSEHWEYHVVYSQSFGVPVLYFRCWDKDGKPLSLTDVWRYVSPNFQGRIAADKWSLLTQQEHPVLKRPFYCLHPCNTKDILNLVEHSSNPIILWLSTVGPAVGLKVCPFYCPELATSSISCHRRKKTEKVVKKKRL